MKNITLFALVTMLLVVVGCSEVRYPAAPTLFPTNHWKVVSVVGEQVVVETTATNLMERFRVVKATPIVTMTNGQPARVEFTLKRSLYGDVELVSAKAYPAAD